MPHKFHQGIFEILLNGKSNFDRYRAGIPFNPIPISHRYASRYCDCHRITTIEFMSIDGFTGNNYLQGATLTLNDPGVFAIFQKIGSTKLNYQYLHNYAYQRNEL